MLGIIALILVCGVIGYLLKHRKNIEGVKPPPPTPEPTPTVKPEPTPFPTLTDPVPPQPTPQHTLTPAPDTADNPAPDGPQAPVVDEPVSGCKPLEIYDVKIIDDHYVDVYFYHRSADCIAISMSPSRDGVNWLSSTAGCQSPRRLFLEDTKLPYYIKAVQHCSGNQSSVSNIWYLNLPPESIPPAPMPHDDIPQEPATARTMAVDTSNHRQVSVGIDVFGVPSGERDKVAFKLTLSEAVDQELQVNITFHLDNGMNMHIMTIPAGQTIKEEITSLTCPSGFEVVNKTITATTPHRGSDWILTY